jgi:hypothetical protein
MFTSATVGSSTAGGQPAKCCCGINPCLAAEVFNVGLIDLHVHTVMLNWLMIQLASGCTVVSTQLFLILS